MDLHKQIVHLLEGEETDRQVWHGKDGPFEVEVKTYGTDRWIRRAYERHVLTGLEFLAVILFVIEELGDMQRDPQKMTREWADAIDSAIEKGEITPRSYDSYLPIEVKKGEWEWVLFLKDADEFIQSHGMGWTCTQIVEHLYNQTFPNDRESKSDKAARLTSLPDSATTPIFSKDSPIYPPELDWALKAWKAVSAAEGKGKPKARIRKWLDENSLLSNEAKERISTVANWDKTGGATRTE